MDSLRTGEVDGTAVSRYVDDLGTFDIKERTKITPETERADREAFRCQQKDPEVYERISVTSEDRYLCNMYQCSRKDKNARCLQYEEINRLKKLDELWRMFLLLLFYESTFDDGGCSFWCFALKHAQCAHQLRRCRYTDISCVHCADDGLHEMTERNS